MTALGTSGNTSVLAHERQFCTFYLDEALFGIDILMVREIIRNLELTPVDQAPPIVRGLMNLRGQIVTVLDPSIRLGMEPRELGQTSRCLIVRTSSELAHYIKSGALDDDTCQDDVGILVDRIGDVVTVNRDDIEAPPANAGGIDRKYLSGVIKLEGQLLVTLTAKLLLEVDAHAATTI